MSGLGGSVQRALGHRPARHRWHVSAHLIESRDEASAVVVRWGEPADGFQNLRQVGSAEVGHAKNPKSAHRIVGDRVHRHDVRVLETGKDLRFLPLGP